MSEQVSKGKDESAFKHFATAYPWMACDLFFLAALGTSWIGYKDLPPVAQLAVRGLLALCLVQFWLSGWHALVVTKAHNNKVTEWTHGFFVARGAAIVLYIVWLFFAAKAL